MIKYLLVFFNLAGLLFFRSLFDADTVSVSHNFPTTVSIGSEYVVEVRINKNEVSGFAEFIQILPQGFSASLIETKNGSFSFSDREVKIIWMTLPEESEFTLKYKITVLSNAVSGDWVDGTFSYLSNNQKATVTLEKKKVEISSTPPDAISTSDSISKRLPVSCKRTIQNTGNREVLVEVAIQNDSVSGFAKLEEMIPDGFTASAADVHGAVFSFVDQKVKLLWMSFPFEKEFKVSYKLIAAPAVSDTSEISGFLSFTIAEESKKYMMTNSQLLLNAQASNQTPQTEPLTENKLSETSTEASNPIAETKKEEKPIATETQVATQPKKEPSTLAEAAEKINEDVKSGNEETQSTSPLGKASQPSNIPAAQSGISYRVQICATHKPVEPNYFKDTYKINEEIYAEMHEGWHKFTLNNVATYKLARDKREELKQNQQIPGPFVTAYNSGTRITVQEALMISNQKWVR